MTVNCEEIEYCKVFVKYEAEPSLVEEKRDEVVSNIKRQGVKLPGFRKGKATELAIRTHFKQQINDLLKREMVSEAYDETLFETGMKPIFFPEVHEVRLDGNNFSCQMTFSKKPEFELGKYTGFDIPKPHVEKSVSELAEEYFQKLRFQHADIVPYEESDFLQPDDQVTIDIVATCDGERIEEACSEGALYTVGTNPVPEIDHKMYGMKIGEEREFDIIFDDSDKYAENIRGKRVHFNVTLHMGTKRILPPLDDELAKKSNYDTYAALAKDVEAMAANNIEQHIKLKVQDQVLKHILDEHTFKVPSFYVTMESQRFAVEQNIAWDSLMNNHVIK